MTDSPTKTKAKKKEPEDLSIPKFLLVENRPKDAASAEGSTTTAERIPDAWETALASLEPPALREYVTDAIRRGRFERTWLVPDPSRRRSQGDVDDTVAHWRGKLERSLSQSAARAAQAKEKRTKEGKAAVPTEVRETDVIRFGGKNPKKEGTAAHKRWEMLIAHEGKTVDAYQKARGNPTTLKNAILSGHVTLEREDGAGERQAGEEVQREERPEVRQEEGRAEKVAPRERARKDNDKRRAKRK
jgi:hypothetical protein